MDELEKCLHEEKRKMRKNVGEKEEIRVSTSHCTVLYCTVLYYTILYSTVLYCTELYCTVLYCTVLCSDTAVGPGERDDTAKG